MSHPVVDVLVAVYVPLARALRPVDINRLHRTEVAVVVCDPAWEDVEGTCVKLVRPRVGSSLYAGFRHWLILFSLYLKDVSMNSLVPSGPRRRSLIGPRFGSNISSNEKNRQHS